jgi:hypothetical protein
MEPGLPRREEAPPLPPAARAPGELERPGEAEGERDIGERPEGERRLPVLEPSQGPAEPGEAAGGAEQAGEQEAAADQPRLVDDSAETLEPGQMRKTEFFAELRGSIEEAAEAALSGTGRTARDCPYITYWLSFYEQQPAAMIEPALRRYAPEAGRTETARDYIRFVTERVSRAVAIWAASGRITGVPEGVPRQSTQAEAPAEERVMRKSRGGGAAPSRGPAEVRSELGGGQPLDNCVRARMEGAFGRDFSGVRVHTGANAASLSDRLGARAFTIGRDVAFAAGEYRPGNLVGDALLAHELAHVVQQDGAGSGSGTLIAEDALERDADMSAVSVLSRLWSGATHMGAAVAANAAPRLRSGLRLSRCGSQERAAEEQTPEGETPAEPAAAPTVAIAEVNAPNTPAAVKRIPPRVDTPVDVTVTGTVPAGSPITLEIDGASSNNGTATINGNATHSLTATETVQLRGGTQTVPGNDGNLKLVANYNGNRIADSNAFSVAAYPVEIGFDYHGLLQGMVVAGNMFWGASYNLTFTSDSGVGADCDETKISENVIVHAGTGLFAGSNNVRSGFLTTTDPQRDHHGTSGGPTPAALQALMNAANLATSRKEEHQFFRFSCARTGIADNLTAGPTVPTSGFKITQRASHPGGQYFMHVAKSGFANNSVAAGAVNDTAEKDDEVV